MKRIVLVIATLMLLTIACSKSKVPTTDTTATNKTGKAVAAFTGSVVRIDFDNAISHVLKEVTPPRAVLIKDGNHQSKLTIMFPSEVDKRRIKKAFGTDAVCKDECVVSPIDGYSFRVVDDTGKIQPDFLPDDSFRNTVPHLPLDDLNDNAKLKVPGRNGDFRAFFNFNGGTLFAKPCSSKLTLEKDAIPKIYDAADFVTLSGTTQTPARLEYTKTGTDPWSKLEFTQSTLVWLVFDNAPMKDHEKEVHYYLHQKVGKNSPPLPKVIDPQPCFPEHPDRGVTVACGNTQWP